MKPWQMMRRLRNPTTDGLLAGLYHWWALEEASGARADSHGSKPLTPSGTVGNVAARIGNGSNASPSGFLQSSGSTSLASGDFTVAGVFKTSASNYGIISRNGSVVSSYRQWLVTIEGGVLYFAVSTNGNSNAASVGVGSGLNNGTLHDFIVWRDTVGDKIWIQLDGGTPVSAAMTGATSLYSATDPGFTLHGIGSATYVGGGVCDEIGIWGRMLSADERSWLRNSGSWRGYADLWSYVP